MLDLLPDELIVDILHHLDLRSVLRCQQVCRRLENVIKISALLQYKSELTAAGMVDGPPHGDTIPIRLAMLKEYTAAWKEKKNPRY
ncbi:hypothetical protein JAAARDRAFT_216100 [Jaapia argillacea MUCL 33604]|uniref:F-box domain-containing protein n=1 Tax=Jaapia argillacea MUCL 33604 TaxID=933084 RepID=A0A067QKQ2_9AGAM|nr:hypothetical protein JAAARDRAFT_216100 [Jaapia argillacea MUCL 33604]